MVGSYGMAGTLLSFDAIEGGPIRQGIVAKVLGDDEARRSVERILEQAKADVRNLLDSHRHLVVALRDALLDTEELVGDEILDVLRARARPSSTPKVTPRTTDARPEVGAPCRVDRGGRSGDRRRARRGRGRVPRCVRPRPTASGWER